MKSIFFDKTRNELIERIKTLNENSTAQWGKMTVYQMLKHCTLWEEMIQEKRKYKRPLMGLLFGKMALKAVLKNENPLRQNSPTIPEFTIKNKSGDILDQKTKWISRIENYVNFSASDFIHPFFGKMTTEQIGYLVFKHIDHHLRQFNV